MKLEQKIQNIKISEIRQSFLKMNLGDVTVKKFGKENDYLVKIEINEKIMKILLNQLMINLSLRFRF